MAPAWHHSHHLVPPEPTRSARGLARLIAVLSLSCSILAGSASVQAEALKLLEPDRAPQAAIDHYLDQHLSSEQISPAEPAGDAAAVRRLTLDLAGRIPTRSEAQAYLESQADEKRGQLVDRLIDSPDFAYHLCNELEAMLLGGDVTDRDFREYLLWAIERNRPWSEMFRDMLLASEDNENTQGALAFLKRRIKDLDAATNDTSRLFFGVSINCAQCHDHPLVADWQQRHYFGMQSFLSRTYLTKKNTLAEKYSGTVKFRNTDGEELQAAFMFLTGDTVDAPADERTEEQKKADEEDIKRQMKDKDAPPPREPEFSPRRELVRLALEPENRHYLARAMVNRTWARLMGRGLVNPLDQMHTGNPPSHPELLEWLARDFMNHDYDLRRLIRGIVLSDAYLRSSVWTSAAERPGVDDFALALPRVLTPRQYALSLIIATSNPEQYSDAVLGTDEWPSRREQLERQSEGLARELEWPGEHFQISVDEALLFSNGDKIQNEFLRDSRDRLLGYLKDLNDPRQQVQTAFQVIHTRPPSDTELESLVAYLEQRSERPVEGLRQVLWAMLTSPELRFNH